MSIVWWPCNGCKGPVTPTTAQQHMACAQSQQAYGLQQQIASAAEQAASREATRPVDAKPDPRRVLRRITIIVYVNGDTEIHAEATPK